MRKGTLLRDLMLNPAQAIDFIQRKWGVMTTAAILFVTSVMFSVDFFSVNFAGSPWSFFLQYGIIFGMIIEFLLVFVNILLLLLTLRVTGWVGEPRALIKTVTWLMLVPAIIYYAVTIPINFFLRLVLQEGFAVYLYHTAVYLMYIWVVCLLIAAVTRDQEEVRISHIASVVLSFAITYAILLLVNFSLVSLIQSQVVI